ncbi:MAG TPA: hypothetical protein VIG95_04295, partial [Gemmatimonadales bacterium]
MIVAKFGGTSVADAAAVSRLIEIVRGRAADHPVVVVSALAKVTDALLALVQGAEPEAGLDAAITSLLRRHEQIGETLPGAVSALEDIFADALELRSELQTSLARGIGPADLDSVASRGELWSSRLVAAALAGAGVEAAWVDIRPIMITDGRFTRAMPYIQVVNKRARDCLR